MFAHQQASEPKKAEFQKYLEDSGVVDKLTKGELGTIEFNFSILLQLEVISNYQNHILPQSYNTKD
jgi:hypothetical protein